MLKLTASSRALLLLFLTYLARAQVGTVTVIQTTETIGPTTEITNEQIISENLDYGLLYPGAIVVDWTYTYVNGTYRETDAILAKWFHYYEDAGEFSNGVLSFYFAHINNGIRHIQIFANMDAFRMHAENTVSAPYNVVSQTLYQEWAQAQAVVYGLPAEHEDSPFVRDYYQNANFVRQTPDIYRWGPHLYGLLNEPLTDPDEVGGPLVFSFTYRYKPGKEHQVMDTMSNLAAYYNSRGEYGTLLQTWQIRPFYGGFESIEVFTNARALEYHVNNTLAYPNFQEIYELYQNIEQVSAYAIGLPAELARAPSIALYYPEILIVQGLPLLKVYGDMYFGWKTIDLELLQRPRLDRYYGFVPFFDILAGIWNLVTWGRANQKWRNFTYFEIITGIVVMLAWFSVLNPMDRVTNFYDNMIMANIFLELMNLFLLYRAEENSPNLENIATYFAYFAHTFGLIMSIAFSSYERLDNNHTRIREERKTYDAVEFSGDNNVAALNEYLDIYGPAL